LHCFAHHVQQRKVKSKPGRNKRSFFIRNVARIIVNDQMRPVAQPLTAVDTSTWSEGEFTPKFILQKNSLC
jgi:hypothetical protein